MFYQINIEVWTFHLKIEFISSMFVDYNVTTQYKITVYNSDYYIHFKINHLSSPLSKINHT